MFSYSAIGTVLQQIAMALIVLPFLASRLSQSKYGEFMLILTIVNFLVVICGGSIVMTIYRQHKDIDPKDKPSYFGSSTKLSLIVISLIAIIMISARKSLFERWNIDLSMQWFLAMIIYMIFLNLQNVLYTIFSIELRFLFLMLCNCIYFLFSFMIIIVYLLKPNGAWTFGFVFAPMAVVTFMLWTLVREKKIKLKSRIRREFLKDFTGDWLLIVIISIALNLLIFGDRWLIAEYGMSKSDIAVYSVAVQTCQLVLAAIEQISLIVLPVVTNLKSYEEVTPSQAKKILFAVLGSIIFIIIFGGVGGSLYIRIFYGKIYWLQSRVLFLILLSGLVLFPLQIFSRGFAFRFHSLWSNLLIYIVACIIMPLAIYSFKNLGIKSFAIGRQMAYIWISVAFFFLTQRRIISIYRYGTRENSKN